MNQQPDKFFRKKLDSYRPAVSPAAWQRVSQNLNKKNSRGLFLKVAAAILLLATGTLLIYPVFRNGDSNRISESTRSQYTVKDEPRKSTPDRPVEKIQPETVAPPQQSSHANEVAGKKQPARKSEKRQETVSPLKNPDVTVVPSLNDQSDRLAMESTIKENVPVEEEALAAKESVPASRSITIVFTADEVNRKYLTINSEIEATTDSTSASGLRKLLDKAQDLKHNQNLLGSLRQKKNQILAMNFRGGRETTQND